MTRAQSIPASAVLVPTARVGLSTASVYPESTATGFAMAHQLGYDAVEIMVGIDPVSQDLVAVRRLAEHYGVAVCSVHAPCLLLTQRVWGPNPWDKLRRSAEMASATGAGTVVVHPPFRWQRDYARRFVSGIADLEVETGVIFAVENMFPWRAPGRPMQAYAPGWDPVSEPYANVTVDVSHASASGSDPLEMAQSLGGRLHHIHMTDGTGVAKDEHLVPGRGKQPCSELLGWLAETGFDGDVVVEINTRRAAGHRGRLDDLTESLAFTRLHLAAAAGPERSLRSPRSRRSDRLHARPAPRAR